ncbi:hypothetical protein A9P82_03460 [Arachidicoccus ginsenosidimutans]|uniref:O-antigen ligase family protein n=1 Tax=Arachidicoccus sp. BS20 TaxID=1850526 RepID=UPI0007F0D8F8|nr:O-antigen ligase family protein [Arachidicoccus sp. BS20]ANI88442.1 hypothetical protein A9P82_03460 [Arachidicoccus sp. BS20]
MEQYKPQGNIFCKLYFTGILFLLLSTVLGIRLSAFNSSAIIFLCVVWIAERDFKNKILRLKKESFWLITTAYYCLYIISIFTAENKAQAIATAQNMLPLLVLPIIFFSKNIFKKDAIIFLLKAFVYAAFLWMSIATIIALKKYFTTGDITVMFYHPLVSALLSNAIYAELICVICTAIIFNIPASKKWKIWMLLFFTIWIILLSSRMFLFIYGCLILLNLYKHFSKMQKVLLVGCIALFAACIVFTNNPIRKRYDDFKGFKLSYLTAPSFNQSIYFDGLSLRLVYWRYSLEILQEQDKFITGVSTGDARDLLDKKIRAFHMNIGNDTPGDNGYLKYSFHGAYLESLVCFGFAGLLLLLVYYGYIGYLGFVEKIPLLRNIFIIMVFSSFSDLIVMDCQCDLSLILTIVYLAVSYAKSERRHIDIPKMVLEN